MSKASLDVVECAIGEVDLRSESDTTRDLMRDLGFGARSLHTNLIDDSLNFCGWSHNLGITRKQLAGYSWC